MKKKINNQEANIESNETKTPYSQKQNKESDKLTSGPIFKKEEIKSFIVFISNKNDFPVIAILNINELEQGPVKNFHTCEKIIQPLSASVVDIIDLTEIKAMFFSINLQLISEKTGEVISSNVYISALGRREEVDDPLEESNIISSSILHHSDFVPAYYNINLLPYDHFNLKDFPLQNKNYQ